MAKLVALEWDAREARIAVGSPRGNDVIVEEAFTVQLASGSSDEAPSISEIATRLAAVLGERGLTGGEALVALPRSSIELRTLNLPHAPPEEIPDMVRFQAMQAFTSIGEDWPIDFVELDTHEESINVLAAVVSPQLVAQTQQVCAGTELSERCLVLRPFAAISLLHRYESIDVFRSSLVVDLLPDGADLTAISNGHVVFMRSVRLPAHTDAKAQSAALVGELRRTIGAAQNQMGGSSIEQIVICGGESENGALRQAVANALSLDVIAFDPFEAVRQTRQLKTNMPEHSGRFAPLLGMLACQATGARHTIDFLNPRKRPAPPSNKRRNLAIAAAVLIVGLIGTFFYLAKKAELDREVTLLTTQSAEMTLAVDKAKNLIARADRIKKFEDGDITWLDEIREVASRMPNADDVILSEVTVGADVAQGGIMILRGNVADTDVIAQLEESLRFGNNRVKGKKGTFDYTSRDYPYQFDVKVFVPSDVLENGHSQGRPEIEETSGASEPPANEVPTAITEKEPDAETDSPGAEEPEQDAETVEQDAETVETAAVETGAETVETGAETVETAAETAETAAETVEPGAETVEPGAETAEPGAETAEPGANDATDEEAANINPETDAPTGESSEQTEDESDESTQPSATEESGSQVS